MLALLDELNPEQRLAVETTEGPVLILASAGTGKTRAITFRMANLIADGVPAEAILAVTFTNTAAEEMHNRVSGLLLRAGIPPAQPWLSTFHSLCARLLRREAAAASLARDFAIYDDDDQLAAVKLAMTKLQIDDDSLTPRNILSRISYAKNHGQTSEQSRAEAFDQNGRRMRCRCQQPGEARQVAERGKGPGRKSKIFRRAGRASRSGICRRRTRAHSQRRFGPDLRGGVPYQLPVARLRRGFPQARPALQTGRRIQLLQSRRSEGRACLR